MALVVELSKLHPGCNSRKHRQYNFPRSKLMFPSSGNPHNPTSGTFQKLVSQTRGAQRRWTVKAPTPETHQPSYPRLNRTLHVYGLVLLCHGPNCIREGLRAIGLRAIGSSVAFSLCIGRWPARLSSYLACFRWRCHVRVLSWKGVYFTILRLFFLVKTKIACTR